MAKIKLDIVTPERKVFSDEVDGVVAPGLLGEFGVLPGHTTLLTGLNAGPVTYTKGDQTKTLQVTGGFAEVRDDHVVILADSVSG